MNIDIWHIQTQPGRASHFFAQHILAHTLNVPLHAIDIARGEFGKPYLVHFPHCEFNISHSQDKMVIAVGFHVRLGIDIEAIKPRRQLEGLVKKCFSPAEQRYWHTRPPAEKIRLFYEFWTRKEALVKGIGRGIAMGLAQCEIDMAKQENFLHLPQDDAAIWHTHLFEVAQENFCGAIAVNENHVTFHHKNWANDFPPSL